MDTIGFWNDRETPCYPDALFVTRFTNNSADGAKFPNKTDVIDLARTRGRYDDNLLRNKIKPF